MKEMQTDLRVPSCSSRMKLVLAFTVVVVSLPLLGGAPAFNAVDLVRQANAAFGDEQFERALELYEQAEVMATDPGLVSFNKAAALFRLGRYHEAETQYLLSRHDAEGERLPRVLYDLGNTLVKESRDRDAKLLNRAIAFYEDCLRQEIAPAELMENARHNLKLAKVLLKKAKNAKTPNHPNEQNPENRSQRPEEAGNGFGDPRIGSEFLDPRNAGRGARQVRPGDANESGVSGQSKEGGMGNLPPIPDQEKLVPLSPEDTAAYLKKTAERILDERRKFHLMSVPRSSQSIKDW
jgi:tetratricopeptide (TPR) repeat protein